jgi:hypothetical protein
VLRQEYDMRDDSLPSDSGAFARKPKLIATCGETLPDGTIVEVVVTVDQLLLCHWDGKQHRVLPCLDFDNVVYTPPRLEPSLYSAVKFPGPPVEYGSLKALFDEMVAVFERRGFSSEVSHCCALFALASWVPEFFSDPPTLVVYASEMRQAAVLFSLLGCLCRRSLLAAHLVRSLPFWLGPTLLVLAPDTTAKTCTFWQAANVRGAWVPSRGGAVDTLACARALFVNDEEALASWGMDVLHLSLLPHSQPSPCSEQQLTGIANQFQPRCLMFRLRRLAQINGTSGPEKQFANYGVSRQLMALVESEPAILSKIAPLLEEQQDESLEHQKLDPHRAIIESIWAPSHQTTEISMAELRQRVNAILCSRGETIQFDSRSLGWKLRHLKLPRGRNYKGKRLLFSREVRSRVHQLARHFELDLKDFPDCPDCKENNN